MWSFFCFCSPLSITLDNAWIDCSPWCLPMVRNHRIENVCEANKERLLMPALWSKVKGENPFLLFLNFIYTLRWTVFRRITFSWVAVKYMAIHYSVVEAQFCGWQSLVWHTSRFLTLCVHTYMFIYMCICIYIYWVYGHKFCSEFWWTLRALCSSFLLFPFPVPWKMECSVQSIVMIVINRVNRETSS